MKNPGPWTFAIFALLAIAIVALYALEVPNAPKIIVTLTALALGTFGARSALPPKEEEAKAEDPVEVARQMIDSLHDIEVVDETTDKETGK